MKVKIKIIPNINNKLEFAISVKNIVNDLIKVCSEYGVEELNYSHDYFKINIKNDVVLLQEAPLYQLDEFVQGEKK